MAWYVVDGMDGSGKSTVAGILKGELEARGRSVLVIAHPNRGTMVGRMELRFLQGDSRLDVIMSTLLYVADVLHEGNRRAREIAAATLDEVREAMGMVY